MPLASPSRFACRSARHMSLHVLLCTAARYPARLGANKPLPSKRFGLADVGSFHVVSVCRPVAPLSVAPSTRSMCGNGGAVRVLGVDLRALVGTTQPMRRRYADADCACELVALQIAYGLRSESTQPGRTSRSGFVSPAPPLAPRARRGHQRVINRG